eukprot:gene18193-biopygen11445
MPHGSPSSSRDTCSHAQGETAEDASVTHPFLQMQSCGTRPLPFLPSAPFVACSGSPWRSRGGRRRLPRDQAARSVPPSLCHPLRRRRSPYTPVREYPPPPSKPPLLCGAPAIFAKAE